MKRITSILEIIFIHLSSCWSTTRSMISFCFNYFALYIEKSKIDLKH